MRRGRAYPQDMQEPADTWSPVDALGEALHFLRMSGTLYCRSDFTAPWALALPPMKDCLMFHVVTAGRCWPGAWQDRQIGGAFKRYIGIPPGAVRRNGAGAESGAEARPAA